MTLDHTLHGLTHDSAHNSAHHSAHDSSRGTVPDQRVTVPEQPVHRTVLAEHRRQRHSRVEPKGRRTYTARERAELLTDVGSFVETTPMRAAQAGNGPDTGGCGVLTGWGTVAGRPVVVVSHDASVAAGAIGPAFAEAVQAAQLLALRKGYPIVHLNDSGGARIHDGIFALHGCGGIFANNVESTTRIPQISVILGPCAGAAAYSPALTDWTIMVRGQGQMFLTGPDVVRAATGEDVTAEEIGGADMHSIGSGVAHLAVDDEDQALDAVRRLLAFLPSHAGAAAPRVEARTPERFAAHALPTLVPEKPSVVFDMRRLLDGVLDAGERLELMPDHAPSILTALGRLDGRAVGVVANQPGSRGGILDSKASVKAARFVDFCGRFGIPVLTFVDVPGFLPGTVEEGRGVITHGAKLLRAYASTRSPKLTVVVRKAYGGAYIAMGARSLGADFSWAWSQSEIAVMGPGGAVALLHRRALRDAEDPDTLRDELAAQYREEVARPYLAARAGIVDEVIYPEETRERMIAALQVLDERGHHG